VQDCALTRRQISGPRERAPPVYVRREDGFLYEKIGDSSRQLRYDAPRYVEDRSTTMIDPRVGTRPASPDQASRPPIRHHEFSDGGDGSIIPSIEPIEDEPPRLRRPNPFEGPESFPITDTGRDRRHQYADMQMSDAHEGQTPKRRRLDGAPEQLVYREISPARPTQYYREVPTDSRLETRMVEYGEPRSSPRLPNPVVIREHAPQRQYYPDALEPSRPVYAVRQPEASHVQYRTQNYAAVSRNDLEPLPGSYRVEAADPAAVTRVYEPASRQDVYDAPARERVVEIPAQEARVRYVYPEENQGRQYVQDPPQRVLQYSQAATQQTYAR
jgi:hypothetical protein